MEALSKYMAANHCRYILAESFLAHMQPAYTGGFWAGNSGRTDVDQGVRIRPPTLIVKGPDVSERYTSSQMKRDKLLVRANSNV
jgi:hypothetical protein